jgi:hypothetical protein
MKKLKAQTRNRLFNQHRNTTNEDNDNQVDFDIAYSNMNSSSTTQAKANAHDKNSAAKKLLEFDRITPKRDKNC